MQIQQEKQPILLIRHAQSTQNKRKKQIVAQLTVEQRDQLQCIPSYIEMAYCEEWMDAALSDIGIQQALATRNQLNNEQIDIVIVSPLRRALQTCDIIFGHRLDIKIFVQPLLAQTMLVACDIGSCIEHSLEKYRHRFDFTNMIKNKDWKIWYTNNISNTSIKQRFATRQIQPQTSIHNYALSLMKQNKGLQSNQQAKNRSVLLRNKLKQYGKLSNKKMAVVGHYCIFKHLTCQKYSQTFKPLNGIQLWNAQFATYNL